ncbi:MAG: hypothetical protein Q9227_005667 [Pyrenula ochraceoflavens]
MDIQQLGMIGAGSMGGNMTLLFEEHGIKVHFFDPSEKNEEALLSHAKEAGLTDRIIPQKGYESLCKSLPSPRVFVFSIPHGDVADKTIDGLSPWLTKGDIIMDASNELWTNTERRQRRLEPNGIHYIGMGVSGGYQSARHGPSISPGGSPEALDKVFPFLQKVAAKDKNGRPCVSKLGPGGCGHYVKMVHNGIEHGMMTVLCEVWAIMNRSLSMHYEEIGSLFRHWNREGKLRDNFLVDIGGSICLTKDPENGSYVLSNVRDKVVQDYDESEGTGYWTCEEAIRLHVPTPTITVSHLFRIASADAERRQAVQKSFGGGVKPSKISTDKQEFLRDLHEATYAAFLMSYIQGLHIISKANQKHNWNLNFADILQLWRGGCIIQSDFIVDLLESVYRSQPHSSSSSSSLLSTPQIGHELSQAFPSLKRVTLKALEADANIPALSASLEYYKYSGSTDLPTQFQEAQLDYFGAHMYDLKSAEPGKPVTGGHHFEWKPARGIVEERG